MIARQFLIPALVALTFGIAQDISAQANGSESAPKNTISLQLGVRSFLDGSPMTELSRFPARGWLKAAKGICYERWLFGRHGVCFSISRHRLSYPGSWQDYGSDRGDRVSRRIIHWDAGHTFQIAKARRIDLIMINCIRLRLGEELINAHGGSPAHIVWSYRLTALGLQSGLRLRFSPIPNMTLHIGPDMSFYTPSLSRVKDRDKPFPPSRLLLNIQVGTGVSF